MWNFSPPDYIQRARTIVEAVDQELRQAEFAPIHSESTQRTMVSMRRLLDCCVLEPEVVEHLIKCLSEMMKCAKRAEEEDFLDIMLAVNQYIQKVAALYHTDY